MVIACLGLNLGYNRKTRWPPGPQDHGSMTKWAKTRFILPVELRYTLGTNSKWHIVVDIVGSDLTSDLEVKVK